MSPRKAASGGWEADHQRLTFYCPVALRERIEAAVAASGRSKTRVIVDALDAHLPDEGDDRP